MDNRTQNQDNRPKEKGEEQEGHQEAGSLQTNQQHTHIDNAHAAGLGSMGRNDEKLPNEADEEEDGPEPNY
ncbi:hypothetical protein SAMN05444008_11447 [Cnuella takakiae]|uniref:Uncharacterized protein n=1 Tax=Cnuella takakiae TaxID=1302690 RepID=A0A1M5FKF4_9BACT|nr:hypothetical protein [Cnuella takakiae]OLY93734.1 hypothetical protein BUE76_18975 [Cnuella takakiae]SHF91983.1 hypothetical protein SAMN05444008_11447 [Cnuella takakiae]